MPHEPPCGPGAHRTVRPEPRLEEEAFVNVHGAPQDAMAQGVVPGDPLDGEAILEEEGREGIGRRPGSRLAPCRLTEPIRSEGVLARHIEAEGGFTVASGESVDDAVQGCGIDVAGSGPSQDVVAGSRPLEMPALHAELGRRDRLQTTIEIGDLWVAAGPAPGREADRAAVVDAKHRLTLAEPTS
jgi:hypothetical protein